MKKKIDSEFGKRLREAFGGASNTELSDKLGVSASAITNYTTTRIPDADTLILISDFTNCSIHWLLTGKGNRNLDEKDVTPEKLIRSLLDDFDFQHLKKLADKNRLSIQEQFYLVFVAGMAIAAKRRKGETVENIASYFSEEERKMVYAVADKFSSSFESAVAALVRAWLQEKVNQDAAASSQLISVFYREFDDEERKIIERLANEEEQSISDIVRVLVVEALMARGLWSQEKSALIELFDVNFRHVRVWGEIAAGKPIEFYERDEYVIIALPPDLIGRDLHALKVFGDSMEEEVKDGEIIVCEKTSKANDGDLVVVYVEDEAGSTLKRIYRDNGYVRLEPRNKKYKAKIYESNKVTIQGVVRLIQRRP